MELGLVGLGRMGANMAQRLLRSGHTVVGYVRLAESGSWYPRPQWMRRWVTLSRTSLPAISSSMAATHTITTISGAQPSSKPKTSTTLTLARVAAFGDLSAATA